jgi:hypothetical protein
MERVTGLTVRITSYGPDRGSIRSISFAPDAPVLRVA